jgi:hypothetical protein
MQPREFAEYQERRIRGVSREKDQISEIGARAVAVTRIKLANKTITNGRT